MRIVSLFPSATEIVVELGLADQLVAISHQCTWPPEVQHLPRVTDNLVDVTDKSPREISLAIGRQQDQGLPVYIVNGERLGDLEPEIVLTQDVCDVCAVPEQQAFTTLAEVAPEARVVTLQAERLDQLLENIIKVGESLEVGKKARHVVGLMKARLEAIRARVAGRRRRRVFIVEWIEPIICSGHWVPDLVDVAGGDSLLTEPGGRSRVVPWEEVKAEEPEVLLIMACGCSMEESVRDAKQLAFLPGWADVPAVKTGEVYILDGSVCARHGPRTIDVAETFARLLHPDAFPAGETPTQVLSWQEAYGAKQGQGA